MFKPAITIAIILTLTGAVLAEDKTLFSEPFDKAPADGWAVWMEKGGIDNSPYLRSKPYAYAVFAANCDGFQFGKTYKVTAMVRSATGAETMIVGMVRTADGKTNVCGGSEKSLLLKPGSDWTKIEATVVVTREQAQAFGKKVAEQYGKKMAGAGGQEVEKLPIEKFWTEPQALDAKLVLRVLLCNHSAAPYAFDDVFFENTQFDVDDVVVTEVKADDAKPVR